MYRKTIFRTKTIIELENLLRNFETLATHLAKYVLKHCQSGGLI